MKILYHHRIASRDGMDVHITEITSALRDLGHEVLVVSPTMHTNASFGQGGEKVRFIRERLPKVTGEVMELVYNEHAYRRLERAYKMFRPDFVYERGNLFLTAGLRLRKKYGVPLLVEVNAPLHEERAQYGGLSLRQLAQKLECSVWAGADKALPVSTVLAEMMVRLGVPRSNIEVVPNGANHSHFNPEVSGEEIRKTYDLGSDIVLGFSGFAHEWHRLDRLVALAAELKESFPAKVLIVGDGPVTAALKAQATTLGIADRVQVTGVVSRDAMPAHLAAFDIAFQPAATSYASPLKLIEYLAMGLPVVAPDMPNIVESAGGVGVIHLFDPSQPDTFLNASRKAIENSLSDKATARAAAKNTRSWNDNALRILEIARNCMSSCSN